MSDFLNHQFHKHFKYSDFKMEKTTWEVLDKGFIELVDIMGDEKTIVNAARVSCGKQITELKNKDVKLIQYLWEHKHMSPFRHVMFCFRIKAPEFVMRQWYKHIVGCEWSSVGAEKDHAWNEISGRYVEYNDFYYPALWRVQHDNMKQCSGGNLDHQQNIIARNLYDNAIQQTMRMYIGMEKLGVAKEMRRILLPLSFYTEVYWTCSLQALLNFIELRDHDHAQFEIRQYAIVMRSIIAQCLPNLKL